MIPSVMYFARRHSLKPRAALGYALLVCALLLTPLGAFTHALSHLSAAHAQSALDDTASADPVSQSGVKHQSDGFCALCSAFAGTSSSSALSYLPAGVAAAPCAFAPPAHDIAIRFASPFFSLARCS